MLFLTSEKIDHLLDHKYRSKKFPKQLGSISRACVFSHQQKAKIFPYHIMAIADVSKYIYNYFKIMVVIKSISIFYYLMSY